MFTDTITITINAVAKVLTRVNQDKYSSEYLLRESLGNYTLLIRHSSYLDKTRGVTVDRHNVELKQTVYAVGTTPAIIRKSYLVFENDNRDDGVVIGQFVAGFVAFPTAGNVTKMINWES